MIDTIMTERDHALIVTELEGAILSEIYHRGPLTAFQIRRSFAISPSLEWQGTAGGVYPAIRRLEKNGMIEASAKVDGRATRILSLTDTGIGALLNWACDAPRACCFGIDPFRIRAGTWFLLEGEERREAFARLRNEIEASIEFLQDFSRHNDTVERVSVELSLRLQRTRLAWLDEMEG